ncbi:hypothetical protein D3C76_1620390 [compost metagenome]
MHEQLGTFRLAFPFLGHDKTKAARLVPAHYPSLITHVPILVAIDTRFMLPKMNAARQGAVDKMSKQ